MRKLLILLLAILLAACNLPRTTPDLGSAPVTETPSAEVGYTQCAWNWATQPLPDLSAEVQSALEAAGLTGVTASAEAYGENCITGTGEVDHFAAMETDFRIRMEAPDLAERAALGNLLERILVVLDAFPPGATPGPNAGYIGVTFQAGDEELRLWFPVADGESARALGLRSAALLDKLQNR
jgi:hypothetical protein